MFIENMFFTGHFFMRYNSSYIHTDEQFQRRTHLFMFQTRDLFIIKNISFILQAPSLISDIFIQVYY